MVRSFVGLVVSNAISSCVGLTVESVVLPGVGVGVDSGLRFYLEFYWK